MFFPPQPANSAEDNQFYSHHYHFTDRAAVIELVRFVASTHAGKMPRVRSKAVTEDKPKRREPAAAAVQKGTKKATPSKQDGAGNADLPGGKVHDLPDDLAAALCADASARAIWVDLTVLSRNEFICWVNSCKQQATRERRVRRTVEELNDGLRRPCCWPGCPHRVRDGK